MIKQTWDDWFRVQTEDHAFQDVIDTLLNSAIFLYIGSILPWAEFGGGFFDIQPWRLVVLGIAIMLLRRLPWVVALVRHAKANLQSSILTPDTHNSIDGFRRFRRGKKAPLRASLDQSALARFFMFKLLWSTCLKNARGCERESHTYRHRRLLTGMKPIV
jgi:hypothetical protein